MNCLFNLAGAKYNLKKYDAAIKLYNQVKKATKNSVRYYMVPSADIMLASIYSEQGNNAKSLALFRDLFKHQEGLRPHVKAVANQNMANTLFKMKQFAEADKRFDKALQIAKRIKDRDEIKNIYKDLAAEKKMKRNLKLH